MKVYIEEIEDLSTHGVTVYSLVQGMNVYRGEVRASGIEIFERDAHNEGGAPLDEEDEKRNELYTELANYIIKETNNEYKTTK